VPFDRFTKEGIMRLVHLSILSAIAVCGGCGRPSPSPASSETQLRLAVEKGIARRLEATRAKDINAFMAEIPDDMVLEDGAGGRPGRRLALVWQRADVAGP
jgi:hypothetical protein